MRHLDNMYCQKMGHLCSTLNTKHTHTHTHTQTLTDCQKMRHFDNMHCQKIGHTHTKRKRTAVMFGIQGCIQDFHLRILGQGGGQMKGGRTKISANCTFHSESQTRRVWGLNLRALDRFWCNLGAY